MAPNSSSTSQGLILTWVLNSTCNSCPWKNLHWPHAMCILPWGSKTCEHFIQAPRKECKACLGSRKGKLILLAPSRPYSSLCPAAQKPRQTELIPSSTVCEPQCYLPSSEALQQQKFTHHWPPAAWSHGSISWQKNNYTTEGSWRLKLERSQFILC